MLFGYKAPRKYGPPDLSGVILDCRSPVDVLAHLFFLAKHGNATAVAAGFVIASTAIEMIREQGVR